MSVATGAKETALQSVGEATGCPPTVGLAQEMSPRAMEVIKSLDSRSFGFLDFQRDSTDPPAPVDHSAGAGFVSREFIQQGINQLRQEQEASSGPQAETLQSELYCQLGHLHLLLEEYSQALSAYEHYQKLCPESTSNSIFLYGMGLIYFHFKAYNWAMESFHKVLHLCPKFARVNEINLRLGVMYKMKGDYTASMDHFERAIAISGPASLSKLEVQFHIGHLYHLQGRSSNAKKTYEGILAAKSVPSRIRARTLRQLGWLYHTVPEVDYPSGDAHSKAMELLKLAVGADPASGHTWYFLGRCHAAQGRAHEAFMAYQQAINKQEDNQADVWCSIGVLYHNMGQPKDSLQSYLCAVYINTAHVSGWTNMGCLYEAVAQPIDALICYKNALSALNRKQTKGKSMDYLLSRTSSLGQYLRFINPSVLTQPRTLPNLHEAWYSLIPKHMRSRCPLPQTPMLKLPGMHLPSVPASPVLPDFSTLPLPPPHGESLHSFRPLTKKPKLHRNKDPIILSSISDSRSWLPPPILMPPPPVAPFQFPVGMGNGNGPMLSQPLPSQGYVHSPTIATMRLSGMGLVSPVYTHPSDCSMTRLLPDPRFPSEGTSSFSANQPQGSGSHGGPSAPCSSDTIVETKSGLGWGRIPAGVASSDLPGHTSFPGPLGGSSHTVGVQQPLDDVFRGSEALSDLQRILSSPRSSQRSQDWQRPLRKRSSSQFVSPTHSPSWTHHGSLISHLSPLGSQPSSLSSPPSSDPPSISALSDALSDSLYSSTTLRLSAGHTASGWKAESPQAVSSNTGVQVHHTHPQGLGAVPSTSMYSVTSLPRQPSQSSSLSPMDIFSPPSSATFDPIRSQLHAQLDADPILSLSLGHASMPRPQQPKATPTSIQNSPAHVSGALPGDLSAVTPLDIGTTLPEDYMQRFLDDAQKRDSRAGASDVVMRRRRPSSSSSHLGLEAGTRSPLIAEIGRELSLSLRNKPRSDRNHIAASPTYVPLSPKDIIRLPNEGVMFANKRAESRGVGLEDLLRAAHRGPTNGESQSSPLCPSKKSDTASRRPLVRPTSSPMSGSKPSTLGNETNLRTTSSLRPPPSLPPPPSVSSTAIAESISDTSSGFSSGSTKLSTTSSGSPLDSPTLSIASSKSPFPSPSLSPSLFGLESSWGGAKNKKGCGIDLELRTPIYEPFPSLGDEEEYMVQDPELCPPDYPSGKEETELKPDCPVYEVFTKDEAVSEDIHGRCCNPDVPICMIRGMAEVLGLDLSLFSTKCLVETCADHEIEVREQLEQAADENWDPNEQTQVWQCESTKSLTTIEEYATYQDQVQGREDDSTQSDTSVDSLGGGVKVEKRRGKLLRFGTNVDLSDEDKWSTQLSELEKLPKFLQVSCTEGNLLTHVGHNILGMNSVQLYMKVTGSRTPGHQENNNFCSININIGEGDCEWFAVPNRYWGVIHKLCEKHNISFLVGSWWPILDELYDLNVPVYRFTQYKGDIVWINPGTVHWVQANSVCNNIAWNTGPITAHQFRMSWERYQWNKIQQVRSIVPMIHLTWNLAKNIKIVEKNILQQVRSLLESSLYQTKHLLSHMKGANIPVHWHGRMEGEPAPCCNTCMDEVFNILFVISHRDQYLVYCHKCAGNMRRSFIVLQQYSTEELEQTLASLKLYKPPLHQKS